ncbi:anaphase-promoting complex subunit 15 isoform X2 [Toxorhynchites rutilus septentrionalis]|uniref:anaphase-promoting complex subunit 15 isoform X2 n=1 Tax=Toxorhynchites rutilus septentrionalis TaxID=329112 RepID=UPI002478E123|nr:anaphase-promoting complex subunit 15 isoform X2 [Toxorhynchites rutilus septentrionalis]
MLPFFPSLRPAVANNLWFVADECCDEDAEVSAMESEHQEWLNRISQIGADLVPIGKNVNEHTDNMDSEDEDDDAISANWSLGSKINQANEPKFGMWTF